VHQRLVRRWLNGATPHSILKTDVFEEAFGRDQLLFDLFPQAGLVVGMDIDPAHVAAARRRAPPRNFSFLATDVRRTAFRPSSFDLILSNSTLDHFQTPEELHVAIRELARLLRPGGTLIVTLDNPRNPLYRALRWLSRRRFAPFSLGRTASRRQLNAWLEDSGLIVTANDWLIHNPRLVSTALFLALRRTLGRSADPPIRALLRLFNLLGRLPTRSLTACFVAACAHKPPDNTQHAVTDFQNRSECVPVRTRWSTDSSIQIGNSPE
jgi:SAM-dependent methyltransferase